MSTPPRRQPDIFLLGYCEDTRALLAHLEAEAPFIIPRVVLLDPNPEIASRLRASGVSAVATSLWDRAALRAAGVATATMVVAFAERAGKSAEEFGRLVRAIRPDAIVYVSPHPTPSYRSRLNQLLQATLGGPRSRETVQSFSRHYCAELDGTSSTTWRRLATWRFWMLVGITVLDGLMFIAPLTPIAMVLAAALAPGWLRRAARFLDALAEAR